MSRGKRLVVWVCAALLLLSSPGNAVKREIKLSSMVGDVDFKALAPLLEEREISLVDSYRSGRLRQVTVMGLVRAPSDRVWQVLTDYPHYLEFMPNLAELEVVRREGNDVVVAYELEVPGSNLEYSLRHHHLPQKQIDITLADEEGDITTGAWKWELIPRNSQTILIYTLYTDVGESSWIIRQVLKSQPSFEVGLNLAAGLLTLQAVKKRAEKPNH